MGEARWTRWSASTRFGGPALLTAGVASVIAGVVHSLVVREHLSEWPAAGAFFIVLAVAQLAWAALTLWRPSRTLLALGATGNLGVVVLWVVSRTIGLPFGPEPWSPEPWGVLDGVSSAVELVLVAAVAFVMLRNAPDTPPRSAWHVQSTTPGRAAAPISPR